MAIDSLHELRDLLNSTGFDASQLIEVPVLDTSESSFAVEIDPREVEQTWQLARGLLDTTGRWPVISSCWGGAGHSLYERLKNEDPFSRFYYEEAPDTDDVSPQGLIRKSRQVDVDAFIEALAESRSEYETPSETLDYEMEATRYACGREPAREAIAQNTFKTTYDLDRWLLDWELAIGGVNEPKNARFDWFEPDNAFLLLLPTASSWETLAYLNWYGTSDHGSEFYIALGKSWETRFGAELIAHYGTMLQCLVARPPRDAQDAWEVAREHDLAAECTLALPGTAVRHYAQGLVGHNRWFLHERP